MHRLLEPPNFSTTPSWAEKYEPLLVIPAPIAPSLELSSILELKPSSIISEYLCLESYDMLPVISVSDPTSNPEIQFRSSLEEEIEEILNEQENGNRIANHLFKIDNKEIIDFINNRVTSCLPKIDNPKLLKFINSIFNTGYSKL